MKTCASGVQDAYQTCCQNTTARLSFSISTPTSASQRGLIVLHNADKQLKCIALAVFLPQEFCLADCLVC